MRQKLLIVMVIFMSALTTHAQEALLVKKTIIDADRLIAVEGATVKNLRTREIVFSNGVGQFNLRWISANDTLAISAIGYETSLRPFKEIVANKGIIRLKQQPLLLQEMLIVSNAGNYSAAISKVDVKLRGINNSQEALRIVPGLFIGQHAGGGKAEQMFLRGFDVDHGTDVNVSVDGMPVNMVSHAHGQGYADLHFVIPEIIETAQFEKGPYTASKGNFTTAGFVDFKTKNTLDKSIVKFEGGQFNTFRGLGMINLLTPKENQGQTLYVASEYMRTNGYFDHPQHFNRLNVFAKYTAPLCTNNNLSITASTFKSKWNASGQIPNRAVSEKLISFFGAIDPNEGGETGRTNLNVQLVTDLKSNASLKQQVYYTHYDFNLFSNFTFFLNDSVNGDQIRQKEGRNIFGYQANYNRTYYLGEKKLVSDIGVGIRYDKTNNSELSHTKNRNTLVEWIQLGDINEANSFAYLNESLYLSNKFILTGGLRLDQFNQTYTDHLKNHEKSRNNAFIASPKLNLHYRVNDRTELYLVTGKGFHSNDARVVSQHIKSEIVPAAYGSDLGVNLKPAKNLFLSAAVWYLYLQQEFIYVGDEGVIEPSGKTRRTGIDLSIRYQPLKKLFIDADLNYAKARSMEAAKGENFLPLAPKLTSSGGVTYKSQIGLNGSLRYRYMADRPANEDNSVVAKGYFITDAVLSYTKPQYDVSLSVQNLLNTPWKETQFYTESRLQNEPQPVSEIHFTPGTPFFLKLGLSVFF